MPLRRQHHITRSVNHTVSKQLQKPPYTTKPINILFLTTNFSDAIRHQMWVENRIHHSNHCAVGAKFISKFNLAPISRPYRTQGFWGAFFSTHIKSLTGLCIGGKVQLVVFHSTRTGLPTLSGLQQPSHNAKPDQRPKDLSEFLNTHSQQKKLSFAPSTRLA